MVKPADFRRPMPFVSPKVDRRFPPPWPAPRRSSSGPASPCYGCGKWHDREFCFAKTWYCHYCNKLGYISKVCTQAIRDQENQNNNQVKFQNQENQRPNQVTNQ